MPLAQMLGALLAHAALAAGWPGAPGIGDPFPTSLQVTAVRGRVPSLTDAKRPVVVAFVRLVDPSSRRTIPGLADAAARFGAEVSFLLVADDSEGVVRDFANSPDWSQRLPFAVASDAPLHAVQTVFGRGAVPALPTAFVVRGGSVLWQGSPDDAEPVLTEVIAGRWSLDAAKLAAEQQRLWDGQMKRVDVLAAAQRFDEAIATLDSTCASALPAQAGTCPARRFGLLVEAGRLPAALEEGQRILAAPGGDRRGAGLAWTIARKVPGDAAALAFALRAAEGADRAAGGTDPMVAGVLARVQFLTGDRAAAAVTVRRALQHAVTPDERKSLEEDRRVYGPAAAATPSP